MSTTTTTTTMEVTATRDESEPKVTPSAMAAVPPVVRDIIVALEERLEKHNENRKVVQNELHAICEEWRKQADDLEERINKELQVKFTEEDDRLLKALNALRESTLSEKEGERSAAARRARAELLVKQSYSFVHTDNGKDAGPIDFVNSYRLNVKEELAEEWLDFDTLPSVKVERVTAGRVYVKLGAKEDEIEVLTTHGLDGLVTQKASWSLTGSTFKANEYLLRKEGKNYYSFLPDAMRENAAYTVRVKSACSTRESKWSEGAEFLTSAFSYFCTWKECPDNVNKNINYTVSAANPKMATTTGSIGSCCTVVGNLTLPQNKITSWSIRILKSKKNNGSGIYIGVAPSDIDQNDYNNRDKCGWYFICYSSALYSGPPHSYNDKEYGPRKGRGKYIHTGDSVGVVMDTAKGELSFVVNDVNLGVAFDGIPLDKPLVPCVLLYNEGDSVELDTSEVKENVNSFTPVPSNITAKSGITWDTITLSWDAVEGASFYQIEVDGSKFWDAPTTNTFTKTGLQPDTEHSFRVRAVCGNEVGEWSDVAKGRTQKESFETSSWKKCPSDLVGKNYQVDESTRVVTKGGYNYCYSIIIGSTPIPLNKLDSWSIKILKSKGNDGKNIFIGVAPSDINQDCDDVYKKHGWYLNCYDLTLCSGPPHNYRNKRYGPRKLPGQYVHNRDTIRVVMDTAKGELSFVVNGVNLGVAFDGIPLDKPLVPCVLLGVIGDSVELVKC